MLLNQIQIDEVVSIAKSAGINMLKYYHQINLDIELKQDKSLVTIADKTASDDIIAALKTLFADIPALSEENPETENLEILKTQDIFWLIDPIDGTRSFVRKRGYFTVNIALVYHGKPIFGVIYEPLSEISYYTGSDGHAYKDNKGIISKIHVNTHINHHEGYNAITSQRGYSKATKQFFSTLNITSTEHASSSIKFCFLAEGKVDLYPHFAPTCIWDTAAGQAILEAAGGKLLTIDGQEMLYNRNTLDNPYFVAFNKQIGFDMSKHLRHHLSI